MSPEVADYYYFSWSTWLLCFLLKYLITMISPEVPDYCYVSLSTWLLWFLLKYLTTIISLEVPDYYNFSWSTCLQCFLLKYLITIISSEVPDYYNFSWSIWLQWFLLNYLITIISPEVFDYHDFPWSIWLVPLHDNNRKFLNILFANKGIDAINISNILNRKEVVKEIPPYFKNQSVPIVSHIYTNGSGRKIFNYKEALQDINIEEYLKNPLTCDCSQPPFQYNPSGHVITGDLYIIQHESPKGDFSWS